MSNPSSSDVGITSMNDTLDHGLQRSDSEYTEVEEYSVEENQEDDDSIDLFAVDDSDDVTKTQDAKEKKRTKRIKRVKRSTLRKRQRSDEGVDSVTRKKLKSYGALTTELDDAVASRDSEGYYVPVLGEIIGDKYRVTSGAVGKGIFSNVVLAEDEQSKRGCAIKIIRYNDMMKREAEKEVHVLRTLNNKDKDDRRHCIRLYEVMTHKGHMCLVFESMWANLRVALKKFGNRHGLNPAAVHSYCRQLFIGLKHLKRCNLIHADLKLDNVLINETHSVLKIADLGSALYTDDVEVTELLVSRFYRAPEVILGHKYDTQIDVWAAACTIYEIATGDVLFKGHSNNDMIKKFTELLGKPSQRFLRQGQFTNRHFDSDGNFNWEDQDKYTKKPVVRVIRDFTPTRKLETAILQKNVWIKEFSKQLTKPEIGKLKEKHRQLVDFLARCLIYDPKKRISPEEALQHPYLKTTMQCEAVTSHK